MTRRPAASPTREGNEPNGGRRREQPGRRRRRRAAAPGSRPARSRPPASGRAERPVGAVAIDPPPAASCGGYQDREDQVELGRHVDGCRSMPSGGGRCRPSAVGPGPITPAVTDGGDHRPRRSALLVVLRDEQRPDTGVVVRGRPERPGTSHGPTSTVPCRGSRALDVVRAPTDTENEISPNHMSMVTPAPSMRRPSPHIRTGRSRRCRRRRGRGAPSQPKDADASTPAPAITASDVRAK